MDTIFHEKQEGQLCAQHCLNNLLQGPHFTAVDLGKIAEHLDQEEAATLAEGGLDSPELASFNDQPSANMDDSGFFSLQVISRALSVWNLTMTLWNAPDKKHIMENPTAEKAFICNHDSHWLTIRKLGRQWFNLNSLLPRPELISDLYLSLFLTQLQMEGYSIFVIEGSLPSCEADELLTLITVEPSPPKKQHGERRQQSLSPDQQYDADLAAAMSASLGGGKSRGSSQQKVWDESYDKDLAAAISMSMQDTVTSQGTSSTVQPAGAADPKLSVQTSSEPEGDLTPEELRERRLKHLGQS